MKKVIWITGGSSGIGKAVALKFANKGWQVIISSRREEVLKDISDRNEIIDYLDLYPLITGIGIALLGLTLVTHPIVGVVGIITLLWGSYGWMLEPAE